MTELKNFAKRDERQGAGIKMETLQRTLPCTIAKGTDSHEVNPVNEEALKIAIRADER